MGHETTLGRPNGARAAALAAGVHLPFTAPLLAGTRSRLRGGTIDFILPNPSGGRGAYVAIWSMVADLAGPTVHDTVLSRRLGSLPSLTPVAVRGLARMVAAEGYAGRAATLAATRAQAAIDAEALRLWAMLLMALIRSSTIPAGEHAMALASLGSAGPDRITDGFTALSRRLEWDGALLAEALRQVSIAFVPIVANGRMRRLLPLLGSLHAALVAGQRQQAGTPDRAATMLTRTIGVVGHRLQQAERLLAVAAAALEEPPALLERWRLDPVMALAPVAALEELLDGWDRICLLWQDAATPSARIEVLPEIALLARLAAENDLVPAPEPAGRPAPGAAVPGRPPGDRPPSDPPADGHRPPASGDAATPREIPTAAMVERNERIRALELGLEGGNG